MVIDNDEAVIGQRQYLVKDVFVSFVLIYFCYALSSFLFILARFFAVLLKFSVWGLDSSFRDLILFFRDGVLCLETRLSDRKHISSFGDIVSK